MTRKDYMLVAEAIRNSYLDMDNKRKVAEALCEAFWSVNPNFNTDKFTNACFKDPR